MRKILGYLRYDSPQALDAINDLYHPELRILQNLFLPSMKLSEKVRVGSKLRRRYDKPLTPLERLLACPQADPAKLQELKSSERVPILLRWPRPSSKISSVSTNSPTTALAQDPNHRSQVSDR